MVALCLLCRFNDNIRKNTATFYVVHIFQGGCMAVDKKLAAIGDKILEELDSLPGSCSNLERLIELPEFSKWKKSEKKYPPLTFTVSADEIRTLKQEGKLIESSGEKGEHTEFVIDKKLLLKKTSLTSLEKLLLAMIWKNGDYGKESKLIDGICNGRAPETSGFVFYQFGQHLAWNCSDYTKYEPIVDKNTIYAYLYLGKKTVSKKIISEHFQGYIEWFRDKLNHYDDKEKAAVLLDNLLFAFGKYIRHIDSAGV